MCFQFTHSPCDDWDNIYTLSYHHHQIGSMNYHPLFSVRSWNNGVRCMSFYILTSICRWSLYYDKNDWLGNPAGNSYDIEPREITQTKRLYLEMVIDATSIGFIGVYCIVMVVKYKLSTRCLSAMQRPEPTTSHNNAQCIVVSLIIPQIRTNVKRTQTVYPSFIYINFRPFSNY